MFEYIQDFTKIKSFQEELIKADKIYLDTEASSTDVFIATWHLLQIKLNDKIFIFDVQCLSKKEINYICQLIEGSDKQVIAHNAKYDIKLIYVNTGILIKNVFDTQLAEILIHNGIAKDRYPSLEFVAEQYTGVKLNKEVRKKFYENFSGITQEMLIYAAEDVNYLEEVANQQSKLLQEQKQFHILELENRLVPVVVSMEINGLKLDEKKWNELSEKAVIEKNELEIKLKESMINEFLNNNSVNNALEAVQLLKIKVDKKPNLTKKLIAELEQITELSFIKKLLIDNLNINSDDQMLVMLRDIFKVPINSTNEKIINKFEYKYPIIKDLLFYREQSKKVSSFGDTYIKLIHPVTKRIHPNFNQLGAQSGRFSSSKPNMLNIPRDNTYRNSFVANDGWVIIGADFSQEELRIMALFDPVMAQAFKDDLDLHAKTASDLFEVPYGEVTDKQRFVGKTLNFAVGYGSTEYGLFKNFGIPLEDGKKYLDSYYNKVYKSLRDFKKLMEEKIWEIGYSKTLLGRKRFFEKKTIFDDPKEALYYKSSVGRELINHVIQGTGADIIKSSLCRIFYENPFGDNLKILLQVYDEIVVTVKDEIKEAAKDFIVNIMLEEEMKYLKDVPAKIDPKINKFWSK